MPSPTITITGTFKDLSGNLLASGTVTVQLMGYGSNLPLIAGVGLIDPSKITATISAGTFSIGPIWGNDVISPGPNVTYYAITMPTPNSDGSAGATVTKQYQFTGSGSFDLSNLTPMNSQQSSGNPITNSVPAVFAPIAHNFLTGLNSLGNLSSAQPASADISDGSGSGVVARVTSPTIATPTLTGVIPSYNGVATVANGFPQLVAKADLTAQAANVGTTLLYTVPASGAGTYRVSAYAVVTQAATVSSTLPSILAGYTDADTGVAVGPTFTLTNANNAVGTTNSSNTVAAQNVGVITFQAKAGTAINYATSSYASSGATPMQYAIHVKLEYLGL